MEAQKMPALYQKRDGKWYCTLRGRQRYLGKNLEVAREKLKGLLEGKEDEKQVETMGEFAEAYLASLRNNQSQDTIRTKAVTYRSFREFVGERTRMGGITAETIERYKQHGFAEGLKRQTVRSRLLNLSALFEHAVKLRIIKTNPVKQVPRVKASVDPDPDHLNEDEEAKLLALTDDQRYPWLRKRDRLIFILMLHAGLRRIEAAQLTWPDIDLNRRLLVVRNGKGAKHRIVGISERLAEALLDCWNNWKKDDLHVITTLSGKKISRDALTHVARKYVKLLNHHYQGRRRFSLHSLRATFATRLCERGVSTRIVQSLLGHADPRTTMRYAAVSEAAVLEAVKKLG
ncbi:MAG: tyrosine-type recombinase/integrase [Planctomycetes bacterium]|nr:tyrosine-type recombinase/integrase [Planctomycetota bacterium]